MTALSEPLADRVAAVLREVDAAETGQQFMLLSEALAQFPDNPQVLTALARFFRRSGRLRDAILNCDAAIRVAPDHVGAWLERAFVFTSGGSMPRAAECYHRVLVLDADNVEAHAGLAGIAARDRDTGAARRHGQAALRHDPGNVAATLALATVESNSGDAALAITLLERLIAALGHPQPDRSQAYTLLGNAYARLSEHSRAHAAYAQANNDFAVAHAASFAGRSPHRTFIERVTEALTTQSFAPDEAAPPAPADRHVFLLGYPRSGNTLVENVLASLPSVIALEERPTLRTADQAYLADSGGLARLAGAGADELARLRAAYWNKVAEAGAEVSGRTFVDMDPLKGTRLPLIARLFPQARVVIVRRDPRDVVWSCFRTSFGLSNAALDFTTLDGAARHYDAMMRLIATAEERLPVAFHALRYEDLVADFDGSTRSLCAFIGVAWDAVLRQFDKTAVARGVSTASASQVRQGLFDGRRQWEPYAEWLAPVMPLLEPWIERFGYD